MGKLKRSRIPWEDAYYIAKEFYKEHEHLRVPNGTIFMDYNLAKWIYRQRSNRKRDRLHDYQIELLDQIGMDWTSYDLTPWMQGFEKIKKYPEKNKTLAWDKDSYEYYWIINQKLHWKKGRLDERQVSLLIKAGVTPPIMDHWEKWIKLAEKYYKKYGNLDIPVNYIYDGLALGKWIQRQRAKYADAKLTSKQIAHLNKIEMIWNVSPRYGWEMGYLAAEEYYKRHGNLAVPNGYVTKDGYPLGTWIMVQRAAKKGRSTSKIDQDQITRLEQIGIVWEGQKDINYNRSWYNWYALATQYYAEHGHLAIPQKYITSEGKRLGSWLLRQRQAYQGSKGKISEEQIKKLELLNINWHPGKEKSNN